MQINGKYILKKGMASIHMKGILVELKEIGIKEVFGPGANTQRVVDCILNLVKTHRNP